MSKREAHCLIDKTTYELMTKKMGWGSDRVGSRVWFECEWWWRSKHSRRGTAPTVVRMAISVQRSSFEPFLCQKV